jgi:hypothetical protein
VSVVVLVLLALAAVLLGAAEWPRVASRLGVDARRTRERKRRKERLRIVPGEGASDDAARDEFARSVERDLASLPTIDPRDAKKR